MKIHELFSGFIQRAFVFFCPCRSFAIKVFELGNGVGSKIVEGSVFPLDRIKKDAELRAPIPQVVVPNYFVPAENHQPGQAFANDGRADVSGVHLLCRIGGGKVDDDFFRLLDKGGTRGFFRLIESPDPFQHKVCRELEVNESGPCNGGFPIIAGGESVDQALSHFARVLPRFFCEGENAVCLEISESFVGRPDLRLKSSFEPFKGFCRLYKQGLYVFRAIEFEFHRRPSKHFLGKGQEPLEIKGSTKLTYLLINRYFALTPPPLNQAQRANPSA